jgi:hypothetical protein
MVMTMDRTKAARLAESVSTDEAGASITVKGFKERDRITKVLDLLVQPHPNDAQHADITDQTIIQVQPLNGSGDGEAVGFPSGSVVTTFDSTLRTRLSVGILPDKLLTHIVVDDKEFASRLAPHTVLTVFYPFPMTITSVTLENSSQILGIEPYDTAVAFPKSCVLATLDNRVRLPLLTRAPSHPQVTTITAVQVHDFVKDDAITGARPAHASDVPSLAIQDVQPVSDIVYLDDNFLVYPGTHRITSAP